MKTVHTVAPLAVATSQSGPAECVSQLPRTDPRHVATGEESEGGEQLGYAADQAVVA